MNQQSQSYDVTQIKIEVVSDQACLVHFSEQINEITANAIWQTTQDIKKLSGIVDLVPSYTTLLVVYDRTKYDHHSIRETIQTIINQFNPNDVQGHSAREIVIPVYYDPEVGPDLQDVADHCGLSVDEVIQLHSQTAYRAYAIGFSPGFAFLGNTPKALHMPRKNTPRLKVPLGSVAIAEQQTAVYPSVTPGGWQILGRTPTALVDWQSENLALIEVGDCVRFSPINREEFLAQGGKLDGF